MTMRIPYLVLLLASTACSDAMPLNPALQQTAGEAGRAVVDGGIGDDVRAVPRPCPAASASDFDFWVGEWQLRRPTGELFATTVVTSELDGCVIMEDFINVGGNQARSMSAFDAATGTWHQIYQDNFIGNWRMQGGLEDGSMVLSSDQEVFNFNTQTFQRREAVSTWSSSPDGSVTQFIEGKLGDSDVFTFFDARYEPVADPTRAEPRIFPFCQRVIPGYRDLDFWFGEWRVTADNGNQVGVASVFTDLNECMVQADFTGRNGLLRRSFMVFDFPSDEWYRYVAENTGEFVALSGTWDGSALTLTGVDETPAGHAIEIRNVVRPEGDSVVETWETRRPNGTWKLNAVRRYEQT